MLECIGWVAGALVVGAVGGLLVNVTGGQSEAFKAGAGLKLDAAREGLGGDTHCNCTPMSLGAGSEAVAEVQRLRLALQQAGTALASGKRLVVDGDAALVLKGVVVEAHAIVAAAHPGVPSDHA